jgi:DNA invertase Pin-like site-specific DNA recombinase
MPRVYGYTRVSPTDAPGTVERHQAQMRRYASERLPGLHYESDFIDRDPAERRRPLACRKQGHALSTAADPGDAILIARFSRAFRTPAELVIQADVWSARGVALHVLDLGLDPTTDKGRVVAAALRVVAASTAQLAKEQGAADFARRRREGLPLNGKAPPGYRYVGPRGRRRLVQDPHARALAVELVRWREAGWSWEQVYFHLIEQRVVTRDGRRWSLTSLRRLYYAERVLQAREAAEATAQEEEAADEAAAAVPTV